MKTLGKFVFSFATCLAHIWSVFAGLLILILLCAAVFAAVEPASLGNSI